MASYHQHIAFLCGHFAHSYSPQLQKLQDLGWEKFNLPEDIRAIEKRFFYPEFVDFCYATESDKTCVRYVKQINTDSKLVVKGKEICYSIKEITIYLMPFKLALFSIQVAQDVSDLNDCTALLFSLRSIDFYTEVHEEFVNIVIKPIAEAYQALTGNTPTNYSQLIENGNKMRLFQIVNTHDPATEALPGEDKDLLLYELATLSKITNGVPDSYGASDAYIQRILESSKISVFNNWSGLALLDTFTIHAFEADNSLLNTWTDFYFRMIYIHSLFQKTYLFNLNFRFREVLAHPLSSWKRRLQSFLYGKTDIKKLIKEYETFDQKCCFHKISYNFLPLEISDAMDKGLEIKEEMEQLFKVLEKEKTRRDEANDKLVNALLFCLSLLTLFSAIWDMSSLLDKMFPYDTYLEKLGGQTFGYRTVSLFLLFIVACLLILVYRRKKK